MFLQAWVAANTAQNALSAATAAVQQAVMLIMNQKATGPALTEAAPFSTVTPMDSTQKVMSGRSMFILIILSTRKTVFPSVQLVFSTALASTRQRPTSSYDGIVRTS